MYMYQLFQGDHWTPSSPMFMFFQWSVQYMGHRVFIYPCNSVEGSVGRGVTGEIVDNRDRDKKKMEWGNRYAVYTEFLCRNEIGIGSTQVFRRKYLCRSKHLRQPTLNLPFTWFSEQ